MHCSSDKMRENIKRMIGGNPFPPEEQASLEKSSVIQPFICSGSSFQPGKPSMAQGENRINIEKSILDMLKSIIGGMI